MIACSPRFRIEEWSCVVNEIERGLLQNVRLVSFDLFGMVLFLFQQFVLEFNKQYENKLGFDQTTVLEIIDHSKCLLLKKVPEIPD